MKNTKTVDALKRQPKLDSNLISFRDRLVKFTDGARPDFHEPDEQGFTAVVRGKRLDNAMGSDPENNYGEMTVALTRDGVTEYFNLASLIALARTAR